MSTASFDDPSWDDTSTINSSIDNHSVSEEFPEDNFSFTSDVGIIKQKVIPRSNSVDIPKQSQSAALDSVSSSYPSGSPIQSHCTSHSLPKRPDGTIVASKLFDVFATLLVSLAMDVHKKPCALSLSKEKVVYTFVCQAALDNLRNLQLTTQNSCMNSETGKVIRTMNSVTYGMGESKSRQLILQFLDGGLITVFDHKDASHHPTKPSGFTSSSSSSSSTLSEKSISEKKSSLFAKIHVKKCSEINSATVFQPTCKGLYVLSRFCQLNGVSNDKVESLLLSPLNNFNIIIQIDRDSQTDKLSVSRRMVEIMFFRFITWKLDEKNQSKSLVRELQNGLSWRSERNTELSSSSSSSASLGQVHHHHRSVFSSLLRGRRSSSSERKAGIFRTYYSGKQLVSWIMDNCLVINSNEAAQLATMFLRWGLIRFLDQLCQPSIQHHNYVDMSRRACRKVIASEDLFYVSTQQAKSLLDRTAHADKVSSPMSLSKKLSLGQLTKYPTQSADDLSYDSSEGSLDADMQSFPSQSSSAYQYSTSNLKQLATSDITLNTIFNEQALTLLFREHLQDDLCEDNLLFYQRLETFHATYDDLMQRSRILYLNYIANKPPAPEFDTPISLFSALKMEPTPPMDDGTMDASIELSHSGLTRYIIDKSKRGQDREYSYTYGLMPDLRRLLSEAFSMFTAFLTTGAPCELNIDHKVRSLLTEKIGKPIGKNIEELVTNVDDFAKIFEQVRVQVFRLMATDSLPKFLASPKLREAITAGLYSDT